MTEQLAPSLERWRRTKKNTTYKTTRYQKQLLSRSSMSLLKNPTRQTRQSRHTERSRWTRIIAYMRWKVTTKPASENIQVNSIKGTYIYKRAEITTITEHEI